MLYIWVCCLTQPVTNQTLSLEHYEAQSWFRVQCKQLCCSELMIQLTRRSLTDVWSKRDVKRISVVAPDSRSKVDSPS